MNTVMYFVRQHPDFLQNCKGIYGKMCYTLKNLFVPGHQKNQRVNLLKNYDIEEGNMPRSVFVTINIK